MSYFAERSTLRPWESSVLLAHGIWTHSINPQLHKTAQHLNTRGQNKGGVLVPTQVP